jgi:hypothetical protein
MSDNKVTNPVSPDPYVAGALLIYGDQKDPYINLPSFTSAINTTLAHKYQLNYANERSANGNFYFRYNGAPFDKLITWDEFFPNYTFSAKPGNLENPSDVPLEYHRSSIRDRIQFIQGVFDAGYDKTIFPNSCGIAHISGSKLLEVQKILWSLGILSTITYDQSILCRMEPDKISISEPTIPSTGGNIKVDISFKIPSSYKNKDYRLYVLGKNSIYPGMFYNVESIENLIQNKYKSHKYFKFKLEIKSIKFCDKISTRNILLNKPYMKYLTDNFLPKISAKK